MRRKVVLGACALVLAACGGNDEGLGNQPADQAGAGGGAALPHGGGGTSPPLAGSGAGGSAAGGAAAAAGAAGRGEGPRAGAGGTSTGGRAGTGGGTSPSPDAGAPKDAAPSGSSSDADLQFCVDENNRYRGTLGRPALARSAKLEAFAAEGAQFDGMMRHPHAHFMANTKMGIAFAENEIPGWGGWTLSRWKTIHAIIEGGLKSMWGEGPGGGHYENMSSTRYTQIGCGVFVNGDQVTVTIDFR